MFQGPNIVQAIRQFDEDNPYVLGRGHEHFPDVVGLFHFLSHYMIGKIQASDFRDSVHQTGHFIAELRLQVLFGQRGIFQDIMQQSRRTGHGIETNGRKILGHGEAVNNIMVAGLTHLPMMGLVGNAIGGAHDL